MMFISAYIRIKSYFLGPIGTQLNRAKRFAVTFMPAAFTDHINRFTTPHRISQKIRTAP
jgi:hypothetical protein